MYVWVYDGSFEGLLTVIYKWFYTKDKPERVVSQDHYQMDLLLEAVIVENDSEQAQKVTEGILQKLGKEIFEHIVKVYLSEDKDLAIIILKFLEYGFKKGAGVINHLADERVAPFVNRSAGVSRESHKLLGLVRFMELEGDILYCSYESTYSLLLILAPHFADRLGNQVWVIHDIGRELAAFYRNEEWHIAPLPKDFKPKLTDSEDLFQGLWQRYYKHIAIEERKNENLRRQNMPKKYWKYLVELKK
jgi:probable DNA metabolism protein